MFEGSENVGKTEHFKYIESAGGSLNASTHADFTNYFEKVPSNQLELALWLESDRMRSLKVTPENFENQLQTVKEEKRFAHRQPALRTSSAEIRRGAIRQLVECTSSDRFVRRSGSFINYGRAKLLQNVLRTKQCSHGESSET